MLSDELRKIILSLSTDDLCEAVRIGQQSLHDQGIPIPDPPTNAGEARRHKRMDCKFQATFVRHTAPAGVPAAERGAHDAQVKDISQGGMKISSTVELFAGEVLTCLLKSANSVEKRTYAEVRHCRKTGMRYEVGLMFITRDELLAAERKHLAENGQRQRAAVAEF